MAVLRKVPDFEKELNDSQLQAVSCPPDAPALVLAGAGSGKTRTLTYRIAYLMAQYSLMPSSLLLLTFTNKAAREMLQRTELITGVPANAFWGGTFHSVAARFLRIEGQNLGLDSSFSIADAEDSEKLLKATVESEFPRFFSDKRNPKTKLLKEIISYSANTLKSYQQSMYDKFSWLECSPDDIAKIAAAYESAKLKNNILDFDDLLVFFLRALNTNAELAEKYSHKFGNVLVDEYQDTNLLQSEILDKLSEQKRISAVGDDAQCIYTWRGANIENILSFKERYENAKVFKIEDNYRSTPEILAFANDVLRAMPQFGIYEKQLSPIRERLGKPHIIRAMDARGQAIAVADKIRDLTYGANAPCKFSDIAILYRAHRHALEMQLVMQRDAIPFVITSGLKFFEYAHIKDAVSLLRFASNPKDFISFSRFIRFLSGIGQKSAQKIFDKAADYAEKNSMPFAEAMLADSVLASVPKKAKEGFVQIAESVFKIYSAIRAFDGKKESVPQKAVQGDLFESQPALQKGDDYSDIKMAQIIKMACPEWYIAAMKSEYENWDERVDDFDTLAEYASRFNSVSGFLESASLEISEAENGSQQKPDCVRMMTIHQAKGLEFKAVFIIGASDGLFPLERCIEDGDVDEERRLFYVACTRAMDLLYIAYPRTVMKNGAFDMCEPSRFIECVDKDLYTTNY